MIKRSAAAAVILLGLAPAAQALEFQPVGSGSVGVGGAGVARNYGAMAPYWNPAGLAFAPKTVTVSLTVGAGLQPEGKLAQDVDDLYNAKKAWDNANQTDPASLPQATALFNAFDALNNTSAKDNLRVTIDTALGAQIQHFGFGVFGTFEGAAIPTPGSTTLIAPSLTTLADGTFEASASNALDNKKITIRGIAVAEVPLSYGYAFDLGEAGQLGIGGSVKYLHAEATSMTKNAADSGSSNLAKDLTKHLKSKSTAAVDLGVLYKPFTSTAIGLVAKNLNQPSFTVEGDKVSVDRQVRAGVSWDALSWLELTADIDVLKNTTIVPGIKSQNVGGGAEFHPFSCLKLRAGGYKDLASASTKGAVTGGLSLGIPWLFFDLDAAYGLGSVKYNNKSYPTEAKVQFSTNIAF